MRRVGIGSVSLKTVGWAARANPVLSASRTRPQDRYYSPWERDLRGRNEKLLASCGRSQGGLPFAVARRQPKMKGQWATQWVRCATATLQRDRDRRRGRERRDTPVPCPSWEVTPLANGARSTTGQASCPPPGARLPTARVVAACPKSRRARRIA